MEIKQFTNIQALRGVAVLLVLGRHTQVIVERLLDRTALLGGFVLGDMGVDLFFVISGFVMVISTREGLTHWRSAGVFLYRRASRIYPLYWFYTGLALLVYWTHRDWLHRYDRDAPISVVKSLTLWPQNALPVLGQGWSLTYELYYYLVFLGLLFLPRRFFVKGLLCWALGVEVVNALFIFGAVPARLGPAGWVACNLHTVEFVRGASVAVALREGWLDGFGRAAGWASAGAGGIWFACVLLPLGFQLLSLDRVLGYGLPSWLFVFGAVVLEKRGVSFPWWLSRLGTYSYSIYLSHVFVLSGLAHFLAQQYLHGLTAEIAIVLAMSGGAVGLGMLSYHFLEYPLLLRSRYGFRGKPAAVVSSSMAPAAGAGARTMMTLAGRGE